MAIKRNMDDPKSRKFWEFVQRTSEKVKSWPAWKQKGLPSPRKDEEEQR